MNSNQNIPPLEFDINWWEQWIKKDFMVQIELFTQTIEEKLLVGFKDLKKEADQVTDDALSSIGKRWNPDTDPSEAYDAAQDAGINYFSSMQAVEQTLLNSCVVSLYQLFEQQRIYILRKEFLENCKTPKSSDFTAKEFKRALKRCDIDIEIFDSWPKVKEMHSLCNAIKHAEGWSSKKLKQSRPDLFQYSKSEKEGESVHPWLSDSKLYFTLSGDGIYVTFKDLKAYTASLIQFWDELIQAAYLIQAEDTTV